MYLSQIQESLADAEGPMLTYDRCLGSIRLAISLWIFYFLCRARWLKSFGTLSEIQCAVFFLLLVYRCSNPIRFTALNPFMYLLHRGYRIVLFTAKQIYSVSHFVNLMSFNILFKSEEHEMNKKKGIKTTYTVYSHISWTWLFFSSDCVW